MTPSQGHLDYLAARLREHLRGEVLVDPYTRALYSTDASMYQIQPAGVVFPRNRQDVQAVTQLAAEHGLSLVPRGAGTSLSGQSIGPGLVVDFTRHMNRILDIDPQQALARVEPGVVLDQLNAAVARHGLQFGPDVATSSRASLGGMIGNNSAGARSIECGRTVDHVSGLDAVLSDGWPASFGPLSREKFIQRQSAPGLEGRVYAEIERLVAAHRGEIIARFPRVIRRASGYNLDEFVPECRDRLPLPPGARLVRERERDRFPGSRYNLARLICGAEGTLATVVEATLHLIPLPAERGVLVLEFASLDAAVQSVGKLLAARPSAIEIFDKLILDLAARSLEYRRSLDFVTGQPESLVIVEITGASRDEVRARIEALHDGLRSQAGLTHRLSVLDPAQRDRIWACRKAALPLLMGIPGQRKPLAFVEDTAVPPERLPEFVARFRDILHRQGTDGAFYGHASVGCLHIRPLLDTTNREDLVRLRRILDEVSDLVLEFGGAMSGEHGDGLARSFLNEKLFGPTLYQAFRQLKAAFDPAGRLNPGKIVDGPPPDQNLRLPPGHRPLEPETVFSFQAEGSLARAAELCSGVGVCRKLQTGTMCPSFMATGNEEHSTRGRANALRLVLSGALPEESLASPRLFQTFDLCLQCKGCKAECPSNVDVARLKAEFLHHYYQAHGAPRQVRALAHVARWNRIGSRFAPLSNWLLDLPGSAWVREKLLGIDHRRSLPRFQRQHFRRWFAARPRRDDKAPAGPIALLDDCLTSYFEPGINQAAVRTLEAAGHRVYLTRLECCGRPLISAGLLDEARQLIQSNLEQLLPIVEQGALIVGCEPSCLLTLVDEYPELVPGELSQKVAASARLIDTYLAQPSIKLPLRPQKKSILLHTHCHQRALVGAGDSQKLLERIPGVTVTQTEAGCCGMAGSWGYAHYEMSMKIGERALFPQVRSFEGASIVAPGFSCRSQIADGTDRLATHPIEQIARRLPPPAPESEPQ